MKNRFNIGDIIVYALPEYASDVKIYFLIEDLKDDRYFLRNLNTNETGWRRGIDQQKFYQKAG